MGICEKNYRIIMHCTVLHWYFIIWLFPIQAQQYPVFCSKYRIHFLHHRQYNGKVRRRNWYWESGSGIINTLRPRQNGRHFADDNFKYIFLNENVSISTNISLKFVPKGPINNIPALVQIIAWRRPGNKPLPEPMMVHIPMHICITRPQWVNTKRL